MPARYLTAVIKQLKNSMPTLFFLFKLDLYLSLMPLSSIMMNIEEEPSSQIVRDFFLKMVFRPTMTDP